VFGQARYRLELVAQGVGRLALAEHEQRPRDYMQDPMSKDNEGTLKYARSVGNDALYEQIYQGRIRDLNGQINDFRKQLAECERIHGKK
jgi:hypothetical protein